MPVHTAARTAPVLQVRPSDLRFHADPQVPGEQLAHHGPDVEVRLSPAPIGGTFATVYTGRATNTREWVWTDWAETTEDAIVLAATIVTDLATDALLEAIAAAGPIGR